MRQFHKFIAYTLLPACLLTMIFPLWNIFITLPAFRDRLIRQIESEATHTAKTLSRTVFRHETPPKLDEIEQAVQQFKHDHEVEKIKVFDSSGMITYSTHQEDIGILNTKDYFRDIVRKGRQYSKVVGKESQTLEGRTITRDVVETYVPVMVQGRFVGAFELYYDISESFAEVSEMVSDSTMIAAGAAVAIVILFIYISRQMHTVLAQCAEKEEELIQHRNNLESQVNKTAKQVTHANRQLQSESADHEMVEAMLRRSEEEWEHTFNSINDPITILDPQQRLIRANRAATTLSGKTEKELKYQRCFTAFCADSEESCENCPACKAIQTREGESAEITHGGRTLLVNASPVFGADGNLKSIIHVARDITSHRQKVDALKEAERLQAMSRVANGIAHDFNNQLGAIRGFCELLERNAEKPDKVLTYADRMQLAVQRSSEMIEDLLAFGRAGAVPFQPAKLDELIKQAAAEFRETTNSKYTLELDLGVDSPIVNGDALKIQDALTKLVTGASRDLAEDGTICVFTRGIPDDHPIYQLETDHPENQKFIELGVHDDAPPLAPDLVEHIFEPFYIAKGNKRGTGLALAAVHGTARRHQSMITCESEEGKGTTFRIYLPLRAQTSKA